MRNVVRNLTRRDRSIPLSVVSTSLAGLLTLSLSISACRPSIDDNLPETSASTSPVTQETLIQDIPNGGITPEKLSQAYLPLAGGTLTGTLTLQGATLAMGGSKITQLATPTASTDAATKGYVDAASATVAPPSVFSMTANSGLYNNLIQDVTPTVAYAVYCFKAGTRKIDQHAANTAVSTGANCAAGDVGFIIERSERAAATWTTARETCLTLGMRLPEPFEWKVACNDFTNAAPFSTNNAGGLTNMTNNWEWASNFTLPVYDGGNAGGGSAIFGSGGCTFGTWGWLGSNGAESSNPYRCAL